jgi:UDP-N-acetylglucosamine 2-epimerase (non-hydrolysing)
VKKIVFVAGARPNFMKISPLIDALKSRPELRMSYALVHTGQHYDAKMSDDFFEQLNIPKPDINLEAGGGSQAEQTAAIMVGFEKYLTSSPADLVVVVGDVTSTLACSIVAKKLNIPVAHVEGGIRSGDITMPEEINRLVTDSISDYFFTTSEVANKNLRAEGKRSEQIHFVGNTMIDTLLKHLPRFRQPEFWNRMSLSPKSYLVMTLHRPSNVDSKERLQAIFDSIEQTAANVPVIFPVHPRTRKNMERFGISSRQFYPCEPLGYLEFNYLVQHARGVITDSGGITEETTVLGIPCMTLRDSTERPETCTEGTNELIGSNPENIKPALTKLMKGEWKRGTIPALWDGKTAQRIIEIIARL